LRLQRQERGAQGDLDEGAASVAAGQPAAENAVAVRGNTGKLQLGGCAAEVFQVADQLVHEGKVGGGQAAVGTLDGKDQAAGKEVPREGLFEQVVAANAGAAGGQEADVVVLGRGVPGGRQSRAEKSCEQPGGADLPGVGRGQAPKRVEHA